MTVHASMPGCGARRSGDEQVRRRSCWTGRRRAAPPTGWCNGATRTSTTDAPGHALSCGVADPALRCRKTSWRDPRGVPSSVLVAATTRPWTGSRAAGPLERRMDPSPWSRQAPPSESSVAASLGSWPLRAWADLTASRRQLRVRAGDGVGPVGASEDDVERLLLAYEELTSNGFRYGRPPVQAVVSAGPAGWLIDVVDS